MTDHRVNYRGYTLIELLVAIGVSGLVFVSIARMFGVLFQDSRAVKVKAVREQIFDTVRMILANPDMCRCNFAGRRFPATTASQTAFSFGALVFYNNQCGGGGTPIQVSPFTAESVVQVNAIQLGGLFRIDDQHYTAELRLTTTGIDAPGPKGPQLKKFNIGFQTQTANGNVSILQCGLLPSVTASCKTYSAVPSGTAPFDRLPGSYSEDGLSAQSNTLIPVYRDCASPTEVMTQCQAIDLPNGDAVCGTNLGVRNPITGKASCYTQGCPPKTATSYWHVIVTCCEFYGAL